MSTMVMATQLSAQPSGYPVHKGSPGLIEPLILNLLQGAEWTLPGNNDRTRYGYRDYRIIYWGYIRIIGLFIAVI